MLTRHIGEAERNMRALLERLLDGAGLAFAEWTALVILDVASPLSTEELVRRQVGGRVAPEDEARAAVDGLLGRGLISPAEGTHGAGYGDDTRLAPTAAGETVYRSLRRSVDRITGDLYGDLPRADLEATRRTLEEIARRANARIAGA
jgi:hypothetical protein